METLSAMIRAGRCRDIIGCVGPCHSGDLGDPGDRGRTKGILARMIAQVKGAQVILIMVHPSHRPRPEGRVRKRGDGVLALEIHGWGEVGRIRFHNMCEEHLQHDMLSPASLSSLLESHLLLHIYVYGNNCLQKSRSFRVQTNSYSATAIQRCLCLLT